MKTTKIHLVPASAGNKYAVCGKPVADNSIKTRKEFNMLSAELRCGRCSTIVNGRKVEA